jgi:hypothetical protein
MDRLNFSNGKLHLMSLIFSIENTVFDNKQYSVGIAELSNAIIVLFWEGEEPKLGSTSISLPKLASTQVIGERDQLLGQMIGTQIASKYNKITLVSTYLQISKGERRDRVLIELLNRLLEKVIK